MITPSYWGIYNPSKKIVLIARMLCNSLVSPNELDSNIFMTSTRIQRCITSKIYIYINLHVTRIHDIQLYMQENTHSTLLEKKSGIRNDIYMSLELKIKNVT